MAEAFAAAGADLVIASRKLDACEDAADEDRRRPPAARSCRSPATSVAGTTSQALYERRTPSFPQVDVLVNNAGMSPLYPSLGR